MCSIQLVKVVWGQELVVLIQYGVLWFFHFFSQVFKERAPFWGTAQGRHEVCSNFLLLLRYEDETWLIAAQLNIINCCFWFNVSEELSRIFIVHFDDLAVASKDLSWTCMKFDLLNRHAIVMSKSLHGQRIAHIIKHHLPFRGANGHIEWAIPFKADWGDLILVTWNTLWDHSKDSIPIIHIPKFNTPIYATSGDHI